MNELQQLYQEVILDHNKNPRNFGVLENANHFAKGHNPLCGDQIDIALIVENNIIIDIKFNGSGCAISKASASLLTSELKGKSLNDAKELYEEFHHLVTSKKDEEIDLDKFGKLAVFSGVREFPARVKCASLAWRTMINALEDEQKVVSTE